MEVFYIQGLLGRKIRIVLGAAMDNRRLQKDIQLEDVEMQMDGMQ